MNEVPDGVQATLDTFYAIISGRKEDARDWERLRGLFFPGARLLPNAVTTRPAETEGLDIDRYIENLQRFLGQHDFFERGEISQCFTMGNLASVVSTYEAFLTPDDAASSRRGINLVHFLHDGQAWRITAMMWRDI